MNHKRLYFIDFLFIYLLIPAFLFGKQSSSITPAPSEKMVFVQGGTFRMGDIFGDGAPEERSVHKVTVSNFMIGKYEVTQQEWKHSVGTGFTGIQGI
jgi:formylglycine-generating enzyme required for sulfatase activity